MNKPSRSLFAVIIITILIVLLSLTDYLLFREVELVWPFFLLPFTVFFILYLIHSIRSKEHDRVHHLYNIFIMIPVLSGLTMSLAWMAKINFWGEQLSSLF